MWEKGWTEEKIASYFDSKNIDVPRKTVLTSYNNKSY